MSRKLFVALALVVFASYAWADSSVLDDVDSAISFWESRNNPDKLQYWRDIRTALDTGEVSDALMERVTVSWNGANPGGRMYTTWLGVFDRFTELRATPKPQNTPPVLQTQQTPPDLVPQLDDFEVPPPAEDQLVLPQNDPQEIARPDLFNPGGGYASNVARDGYSDAVEAVYKNGDDPNTPEVETRYKWSDAIPAYEGGYKSWGPWDDLPRDVQQEISNAYLSAPTTDILGKSNYNIFTGLTADTNGGTARWEGRVHGVLHPNFGDMFERPEPHAPSETCFSDVCGAQSQVDTWNRNEDFRPRIEFKVDLANPSSAEAMIEVVTPAYYTSARHDPGGGQNYMLEHFTHPVEYSVIARWYGIDLTNRSFQEDGLYGTFRGQPGGGTHDFIEGFVNRPAIVGSYAAEKQLSSQTNGN